MILRAAADFAALLLVLILICVCDPFTIPHKDNDSFKGGLP